MRAGFTSSSTCGRCGSSAPPSKIGSDRVDSRRAEWCGPCKMMAPQFEAAARSLEPHVRLGKLDTEAKQQIAGRYGIRGTPTMILFRSGKEIARTSGAMPAAQIAQWARSHV
ncbi:MULTISPECIES: co-chaperone YbbN [unclassified Paracoccus (in: a-proteobacteria)]|uniref:thioredoxin family protein n=1 Tax=unclassified Paracoccus (in: a-proteobacteria) TaxID=2688777 RepID=UPI0005FA6CE5|nr:MULTISPECIES: thioredoxin domain-containing protein [unclassified Paracoccus (in: a-proteobacteria)]